MLKGWRGYVAQEENKVHWMAFCQTPLKLADPTQLQDIFGMSEWYVGCQCTSI